MQLLPTLSLFLLYGQVTQLHCQVHVSEFFYLVEFNQAKKPILEDSASITLHFLPVFRTKQGAWNERIQLMKGFPSTRTTDSVRLILGSQYSLCENYIKQARLPRGLKQVLGSNLIPLRTKFDTQTKRMPALPLISGTSFFSQWYFPFSGRSQMKFYER